jgi:hypothetical protein
MLGPVCRKDLIILTSADETITQDAVFFIGDPRPNPFLPA